MRRGVLHGLAWGGFGLLVWGAWLAFPQVPGVEPGPGLRAVIVDGSASAVRRRPGWGARVREVVRREERSARAAGEEFAVVLFGRDVMRLREEDFSTRVGWLAPALEQTGFGAGTELAAAISSVEMELVDASRRAGSLVIVGDGEWTGGDPRPGLARLARAGVACSRVGLGAARWPDLGILGVRLPQALSAGEPLAAVCELAYRSGVAEVAAELVVECQDAAGRRRVVEALALPAGGGVWSVAVDLGPCADGEVVVDARVRIVGSGALSAGDPVGENDRAGARTRSGGVLLGLATVPESQRAELEGWLEGAGGDGIHWAVVAPEEVGERLFGSDLLLSYEVSTAELPAEWLGPFLKGGGGWLAAGGWGLLADFWPRGMAGSAAASEWLPLVPAASDAPEREVVFCVDGSGSMAGEPFESVRGALLELVRAVLPSDRLQMRFFTAALGPVIELGGGESGDRVAGLRELLDAQVPGGATDILSSLESLARARQGSEVPGLVLLLSDGRDDNAFQTVERAAELRRSFAESRTRLSVIGIGSEADLELLGELAGGVEEVLLVERLDLLAELFRREVARERVREGDPVGVVVVDSGLEEVAGLVRAWGGREEWPEVERLGRMEARDGAAVLLRSAEGLPVLGIGRVGEGWAAAFPGRVAEGWAPGFGGAADVWAPLWRFLGRGRAGQDGELRLDVRGEELILSLGSAGEAWPAEVLVEFRGRGADGGERVLGSARLGLGEGTAPGVMGSRVGSLGSLGSGGGGRWRAQLSDARSGEVLGVLAFERPAAPEFRPFVGLGLGLGALEVGAPRLPRSVQAVPDGRAPLVIGIGLGLLALAALLGRWRAGWGGLAANNSQSGFRPSG